MSESNCYEVMAERGKGRMEGDRERERGRVGRERAAEKSENWRGGGREGETERD